MRIVVVIAALLILAIGLHFILQPVRTDSQQTSGKLLVVATIFPLADWLHAVGGENVEVHCLVSGSANPHHFEPTMQDAIQLSRSRAVFAIGLGLDPWAEHLVKNSGQGAKLAYFETGRWIKPRKIGESFITIRPDPNAAKGKDVSNEEEDEAHALGDTDPHYWLDPQRAIIVVAHLAGELGTLDPAHRDEYKKRAEEFTQKLQAIDAELRTKAQSIPPGKQLVTFHDAYGYLLERLGVKLAAVVQVSPGVEPNPHDVADAFRIMRSIGQRTVFKEPAESSTAVATMARELGGEVMVLDPMDTEVSESGKTYLERLGNDLNVLVKAVDATATPAKAE